ncbi:hypothetical protein IYX23_00135 [Methylocystis sp. L43]|jgi:hypothetical protein|uniref:hypothetical protein n=1 Tax=unclassified Methylocystis TaxID=2625913 RepID=UPI0018C29844|nr:MULTISPECIES: hypothetical protein [unclassified Methylocystis]MBG0796124.1 hypothetical protein [Methylocystis sp. L43]MBG0804048.1 hypothetical protein [Methylocystis sp. H15]
MKNNIVAFISVIALTMIAAGASASTASQREYKRGYADCKAGRWDENQHGESYKKGCRAAEDQRAGTGASAATEAGAGAATKPADGGLRGDKTACLLAVKRKTNNPKVVVLSVETSEANNTVTIGVGPDRAPWRCLVKRGIVADVMSLTDEGKL